MSKQEGKVVWSLEDCLKKAELAIKDQTLVVLKEQLIRTERSPDWVWREARRRLKHLGATEDLNADQEALASSYWALAKLKRDYLEEFDKRIKPEEKEMGEKIKIEVELDRDSIIQILEKFGIDVKICGFCQHYNGQTEKEFCNHPKGKLNEYQTLLTNFHYRCRFDGWEPKEKEAVKLESAPTVEELEKKSTRGAVEMRAAPKK